MDTLSPGKAEEGPEENPVTENKFLRRLPSNCLKTPLNNLKGELSLPLLNLSDQTML
jgi:hypothetical protein